MELVVITKIRLKLSLYNNPLIYPTFRCSEAVLGLSGVPLPLAGVAATDDGDAFPNVSAGILDFEVKYPKTSQIYKKLKIN